MNNHPNTQNNDAPAASQNGSPGAQLARRRVAELRPHPHASEVPALSADEYDALKADLSQRGLQVPLEITAGGLVLDGHARLRAALELGLAELEVLVVEPADELEHILRAALLRRQLSPSQRAALALKLASYEQLRQQAKERQRANLRQSTEVATLPARGKRTREVIAELAGASPRTVADAITVHDGDPALFERVLEGKIAAHTAARRVRRATRDQAIGPPPPLPEGPFELILADPPWELGSPDSDRAPENHYPCMPLAEIEALQVPAADNAVLYLWALSSLLPEAIQVMQSWGFSYRTGRVWVKHAIGPGQWVRHRHEHLLIGRKGSFSPPEPADRPDSVIEARRERHSQKPDCVYHDLERAYPYATKVELFARTARPGWAAWGNQAPQQEST
jgi:N6-adenosine-specific RNA methylase IME4/ParB-like chromosome segregation protein Spo0J